MSFTAAQCRAARALIGWSQDKLADASKVAKATIANFELGKRDPYPRTLDDLREALELAGVEFTNGGQPGVRLKSIFLHAEQGSERLLFVRSGSDLPAGKWDGGRPIGRLPKSVRLNERGWFVWEEPTEEDRRLAGILYPANGKS